MPADSSFSEQSEFDQTYSYTESRNSSFSIATSPSELSHSHVTSPSQSSTQTSPDMYVPGTERLAPYDFVYGKNLIKCIYITKDKNVIPKLS
jgi:hypothetical protein